jgi:hypothetical protein
LDGALDDKPPHNHICTLAQLLFLNSQHRRSPADIMMMVSSTVLQLSYDKHAPMHAIVGPDAHQQCQLRSVVGYDGQTFFTLCK